jgi:hypothetical protein
MGWKTETKEFIPKQYSEERQKITLNLLKRKEQNYLKLIKEKRALGEADHPESSIVAVSRISHNVVDLWWEGNVLMGKLEIIMSPGFVNQGIISCEGDRVANYLRKGLKIGVSSRGVGSLEKEGGKNMVQDDFELICWDIVTSPSTPGSWIYSEEPSRDRLVKYLTLLGNIAYLFRNAHYSA